jgi:uncharacterized protein YjiS (DUF1127 family)
MTTKTATWGAESLQPTGINAALSGIAERLRRFRAQRRTHLILADLDDHTLDDIGLDPSHVRRTRPGAIDWVVQTHSGTARLVFIGR